MTDVVIVGGGIAGVSAAYYLSEHARVTVVEQEATLTYHTTGRSAALLFENYGSDAIRPLTHSSLSFLRDPPPGLADGPLLSPRGGLVVARPDQVGTLRAEFYDPTVPTMEWLTDGELRSWVPRLRSGYAAAGVWDPAAMDIDVAALHQAYVRGMRARDGEIITTAPVVRMRRGGSKWHITAGNRELEAGIVVNAAGAWGDVVAGAAGVPEIGLRPLRRTAFMVPGLPEARDWPMVIDADEEFYFKPDGGQFLCSPADETQSEPCDARPDEIDIALAIERINTATTLGIGMVRSAWAGLRTFAADRAPVTGFDPEAPGFFWLVGQGGTGIQTSPGAGRLAAALITDGAPPADMVENGVDPSLLAPERLRS